MQIAGFFLFCPHPKVNPFSAIPFFRILLPYIGGILCALYFGWQVHIAACLFFLIILLLTIPFRSAKARRWSLLVADLCLFCLALSNVSVCRRPLFATHYTSYLSSDTSAVLLAQINDVPVTKTKSRKCELKVLAVAEGKVWRPCRGKVLLYVRSGPFSAHLQAGDRIQVKARWQKIRGPLNPGEFNYQQYLSNRYIERRAYADSTAIVKLPPDKKFELWFFALSLKTKVLRCLARSGLSDNAVAICGALLTGFDDEIEKEVLQAFSHSGTLHILSVSGLHTGLIYAVLAFLFRLVDRQKKYRQLEFLVLVLILWSFALFTGFSPPVMRAVIMFNLLGAGKLYFRNSSRNQINILAVSAFSLLLYDPLLIMDVGFLLSYGAMFGLMYFQPAFQALVETEKRLLLNLWSSTSASFAATLCTLPLTLCYFKQFPLWFVLCNFIVVPASFVLLMLAFLVVIKVPFLIRPANLLTDWMLGFVELFDSPKGGYIEAIDFRLSDALFLSLILILFSKAFARHSRRLLYLSILGTLSWQLFSIWQSYESKSNEKVLLFSLRKSAGLAVKHPGQVSLWLQDSSVLEYSVKPWLISQNYAEQSTLQSRVLRLGEEYIVYAHQKDSFPRLPPEKIKYLICSSEFKITKKLLKSLPGTAIVFLDGTNGRRDIDETIKLCRNFGRMVWVLSEKGACQIGVRERHYEIENW